VICRTAAIRLDLGRTADDELVFPARYRLNNDWPTSRFWRTVRNVRYEGREYHGELPFLEPADQLFVCANLTYKNGVRSGSGLLKRPAASVPGVRPTLIRETLMIRITLRSDRIEREATGRNAIANALGGPECQIAMTELLSAPYSDRAGCGFAFRPLSASSWSSP
jgi:hypothetical protein